MTVSHVCAFVQSLVVPCCDCSVLAYSLAGTFLAWGYFSPLLDLFCPALCFRCQLSPAERAKRDAELARFQQAKVAAPAGQCVGPSPEGSFALVLITPRWCSSFLLCVTSAEAKEDKAAAVDVASLVRPSAPIPMD